MVNRVVTKALAGIEDLLLGTGQVTQERASGDVQVTKIDAANLPYENAESLRTRIGKKIEVLTNVAALQALVTATSEEKYVYLLGYTTAGDGGGGLFYLDTTDTTSVEDLSLIFNPDTPASGRWKRIDTGKQLSPDNGDTDKTIEDYDEGIQLFATPLTADRTITLPSSGLFKGKVNKILRLDTALFTLAIGTAKTIPEGESALVEVTYDGFTWVLTNYVTLVSGGSLAVESLSSSLSFLLHPDSSKGHRELYSQGIKPYFFNQNWGGPNFGGGPDDDLLEIHTAQVIGLSDSDSTVALGDNAARSYQAQGFKVGINTTLNNIIISVTKVGLPIDNLQLSIYDDSAADPNAVITNGIATAISGKEIGVERDINNTDCFGGAYTTFTFATPPALVANTQYHIVLTRSGAIDAVNYYTITSDKSVLSYPYGLYHFADATPTWTGATTDNILFYAIINTKHLQTGGLFEEGNLVGFEATSLGYSAALKTSLKNIFSTSQGTLHIAGTAFTKNKTILDLGVSVDKNRIVIRCNITTGFIQIVTYENDTTSHTLIGTTDVSSGNHIIDLVYRAKNDGGDFLALYIDGINEVELTSLSLLLANDMISRGHCSIGAGEPLAPVWTEDVSFSSLPSLSGWTWLGGAVETECMSVNNGILYQTSAGYGANMGYYSKNLTLDNSIGWVVEFDILLRGFKLGTAYAEDIVSITDGDRKINLRVFPKGVQVIPSGSSSNFWQIPVDLSKKHTFKIIGKNDNVYFYIDNELVYAGEGEATLSVGTNYIYFGDTSATGDELDLQWSRFRYYDGTHLPEVSAGEISEVAFWSEDKRAFLSSIYNNGTIKSVKQLAQVKNNFVLKQNNSTRIVLSTPGVSFSTDQWLPILDMYSFTLGKVIHIDYDVSINASGAGSAYFVSSSGLLLSNRKEQEFDATAINEIVSFRYIFEPSFGLAHNSIWIKRSSVIALNLFDSSLMIEEN